MPVWYTKMTPYSIACAKQWVKQWLHQKIKPCLIWLFTACPSNCGSCDWDDSLKRTKCKNSGCDSGYVFRSSDGTCPKCPDNCASCRYNSTSDMSECDSCTTLGFIINDLDPTNCLSKSLELMILFNTLELMILYNSLESMILCKSLE